MEEIIQPIPKAFVLLSGGMDSTTCLYQAMIEFGDNVEAISVNYGQRHLKEMEYAKKTCQRLGVDHKILNVQGILSGDGVMLTDSKVEIPDISYNDIQGVSPTYVPFRNGTLLSLITAHAQKYVMSEIERCKKEYNDLNEAITDQMWLEDCKDLVGIYFGAHAEDAHNWAYPDCTPEFIGSMTNAIYTGTYYTVRLHTPLMWFTKVQVVQYGEQLGVDWADTWSCYAGGEKHCGTCPTCRARREAFETAGVKDPTKYREG